MHKYPLLIREAHLDTFGHVNNATYLAIYEEARWDLITGNGYGLGEIIRTGLGPTILEINVKYLKEIKLREHIIVTTEYVGQPGPKITQLKQQMLKADGKVASEALITFGLFDTKLRKLVEPTPEWKKALGLTS